MKQSNKFHLMMAIAIFVTSTLLQGCAVTPASRTADGCVLGLQHGQQVMGDAWGDPTDAVITKVLDRGQGFVCPPVAKTS